MGWREGLVSATANNTADSVEAQSAEKASTQADSFSGEREPALVSGADTN